MNFKFFLPIAALGIFGACASHEGINEKDGTFELTTDKGICLLYTSDAADDRAMV